jgi:hypothetical protein
LIGGVGLRLVHEPQLGFRKTSSHIRAFEGARAEEVGAAFA